MQSWWVNTSNLIGFTLMIGALILLWYSYLPETHTKHKVHNPMDGLPGHEMEPQKEAQKQRIENKPTNTSENIVTLSPDSPYVYLTVAKEDYIKEPILGKVVIKLWDKEVPATAHNFRTLCLQGKYQNVPFHRVIQDFMIQGGDITKHNGTGGESIWQKPFPDENLTGLHNRPGLLSMANAGPNTNQSQFFILTAPAPHLDGKHVIFGEVIDGMEHVYDIEKEVTDSNDAPIRKCYIVECGEESPTYQPKAVTKAPTSGKCPSIPQGPEQQMDPLAPIGMEESHPQMSAVM